MKYIGSNLYVGTEKELENYLAAGGYVPRNVPQQFKLTHKVVKKINEKVWVKIEAVKI